MTGAVPPRRLPRLTGPRVVLVPVPHAAAVAAVGGVGVRAALAPLALVPGPGWPHEDTADALRPHAEHGDPEACADLWFVVDGDEVVGECGLTGGLDAAGDQEIGYGLAAPSRGHGIGTEAVALLCAWVESQPGVRRVVADVVVGNEPSRRLLARLGFTPEPGVPPYERWARSAEAGGSPSPDQAPALADGQRGRPVGRLLPGPVTGRHVC